MNAADSRFQRPEPGATLKAVDSIPKPQDLRLKVPGSRLDSIIAIGLTIAIVFSALAFGSVEAWAMAVLESIAVMLIGLWITKSIREREIRLSIPVPLLPVAGLVCWGLVQSISIGAGLGARKSISMDPEASSVAVISIFFLLMLALGAANFLVGKQRLRYFSTFLVFYGLALAVFGLIQSFTWDGAFYWLRPTHSLNGFGPFANRDHFAGYMEMLAPFPAALILTRAIPAEQRLAYGFAGVVMVIGTIAALSRGGMLSLTVEGIFIVLWTTQSRARARASNSASLRVWFVARTAVMLGVFAAVAALGTVWLGADHIINKATSTISDLREVQSSYVSRQWIWADTWSLIKSHPITGTGIGTFEAVFPQYSHNNGRLIVAQSHNDYLQVLADCGLMGASLTIWFLVAVIGSMRRALKSEDELLSGIALACSAGITGMLVHSFFDFNLQIPSNALLFLFLSVTLGSVAAAKKIGRLKLAG